MLQKKLTHNYYQHNVENFINIAIFEFKKIILK